jgi:hypothetical protein
MITEDFNCDERHILKSCLTERINELQKRQAGMPFGCAAYQTCNKKMAEVQSILDKIPLFKK